jgi:hypothetical protein
MAGGYTSKSLASPTRIRQEVGRQKLLPCSSKKQQEMLRSEIAVPLNHCFRPTICKHRIREKISIDWFIDRRKLCSKGSKNR